MPAVNRSGSSTSGRSPFVSDGVLATLCYQSRAPKQPNADELSDLLSAARDRNRSLGVTGMLVHEGERFFQWLEGPGEALDGLWKSISHDDRHEDVELLGEGITPARLFSDWDLRFLERSPHINAPEGAEANEGEAAAPEADSVVLARLALNGDEQALAGFVRGLGAAGNDPATLCGTLFEPAAHQLGDWWCEDVCTSFEITSALGRLQSLIRRLDANRPRVRRVEIAGRNILVSPPPHESHLIGATLLGGFFHRAGWSVQAEFPQDDPALMSLVSAHWFDALALTVSDVFTRRDRLAALVKTIKDVRAASRNPKMAVIVGGRVFRASADHDAERVGADVHYQSASQAVGDLDYWLFMNRSGRDGQVPEEDAAPFGPLDIVKLITPALAQRVTGKKPA